MYKQLLPEYVNLLNYESMCDFFSIYPSCLSSLTLFKRVKILTGGGGGGYDDRRRERKNSDNRHPDFREATKGKSEHIL